MPKKSVKDIPVRGRRVLVRADFNVPLDDSRQVTDDRRIRLCLPTIRQIVEGGGRAILMSHLGRPSGDPEADARFSLAPVATHLEGLLGQPVRFAGDCTGKPAEDVVGALRDGDVALLENLRFHKAETIIDQAKKNPDKKLTGEQDAAREAFAEALAGHGEIYINNAFGTCHRRHVSMYDVPKLLPPGTRGVGDLVERELHYLGEALASPKRPFVAILGGAKVSDKIGVIRSLMEQVDRILIGGAMTFTFWAARGTAVGKSLCEPERFALARELLSAGGEKIMLPSDSVAAAELKAGVATRVVSGALLPDLMGLDIGPDTINTFADVIRSAGTIVWNGPVGAFETSPFEAGTFHIARAVADATKHGAVTIIGGGDSAAAVEQAGLADSVSHISTGGGASLEFLEKRRFDTIDILDDA
jgi:phosphoglycerate kinase